MTSRPSAGTDAFSALRGTRGLGIGWGGKAATIEAHGKAIDELRTQQKADHDCLTELRKDIAYIREGIQEIKQSLPKAQSAIVSPGTDAGVAG